MIQKADGVVEFWHTMKGFGFIVAEDGQRYFMHASALPTGLKELIRAGDRVRFSIVQGDRGPKAVNVNLNSGR